MQRDQPLGCNECVYPSWTDARMTQQLLDHPQIGTSVQQASCKEMPEAVSTERSFDPIVRGVLLHHQAESARAYFLPTNREEHMIAR